MEEEYLEHLSKTQMFLFCVGLIIINMIKPNFIIAFAPMMAIYLCVDLVTSKVPMKKKFKQIILFGSCVLPSLAVLFFQNKMLFPEDSESGMVIKIGYSFMRTGNPYAKIILGLAFPILILVFNCKELVRDRVYGSAWLMWLISFLEYFIFAETGKRQTHGNLAWGMLFGTFFLFIISIYKFICNRYSKSNNKIYYRMGYVLLACHAFSGIFYFIKLLLGGSYGV